MANRACWNIDRLISNLRAKNKISCATVAEMLIFIQKIAKIKVTHIRFASIATWRYNLQTNFDPSYCLAAMTVVNGCMEVIKIYFTP